ncbi:hypothetical protein D3C74_371530 [compost metagenome]
MILKEHGLGPKQQIPKNVGIIIDIGFSYDEIRRINTYQSPQYDYVKLAYPLVEANKTTEDSILFLEQHGYPLRRSRCYLCPFNCSAERAIGMDWEEIIESEPFSFVKALWFDAKLREVRHKNYAEYPISTLQQKATFGGLPTGEIPHKCL